MKICKLRKMISYQWAMNIIKFLIRYCRHDHGHQSRGRLDCSSVWLLVEPCSLWNEMWNTSKWVFDRIYYRSKTYFLCKLISFVAACPILSRQLSAWCESWPFVLVAVVFSSWISWPFSHESVHSQSVRQLALLLMIQSPIQTALCL